MVRTFTEFANKLEKIERKKQRKFNRGLTKNLKKRKTGRRSIYSI